MRKISFCKLFLLLLVGLVIVVIYCKNVSTLRNLESHWRAHSNKKGNYTLERTPELSLKIDEIKDRIVISFVVCNTRFKESLNVVKSTIIFTKSPVLFVIFTDDHLWSQFNSTLSSWREITAHKFDFELQRIKFPEAHKEDWLNLFSKCAAQRLFIPKLLPHIDSMIYVDTDTLFLGPADQLWQYFHQFNSTQISAMTLEDDNPNISWYPRFAKHPFYGKYGLNSGVMLMNLTRMRDFGWVDYVTPIMLQWKLNIPWGDQDIINIIFHYQPRAVFELPCRVNFRTDQCVYGAACPAAGAGVLLLHGSRGAFHGTKQPAFKAVYRAIDEHALGREPPRLIVERMERYLDEVEPSNCQSMKSAFLKLPRETIGEQRDGSDLSDKLLRARGPGV